MRTHYDADYDAYNPPTFEPMQGPSTLRETLWAALATLPVLAAICVAAWLGY